MHIRKQICAAIAGTLFFLVCTASVAVAENEIPPVAPPPEPESIATTLPEQPAPASQEPTVPLDSNAVDDASDDSSIGESDLPVEQLQPDEETWRAVVDGLRPSYWDASVLPAQGKAMYYNPGVFEQVMDFRFKNNHITQCDECIGHVALLRGGDLDRRVWLQREGQRMEGPFWVVDAAAFKHIPTLLSRDWVVDVDHDTAMRWRMAGPVPITVYDADSPEVQAAAAATAQPSAAAQTYALVGFLYKCAILPLETNNYRVLDALADSAVCLTSSHAGRQPAAAAADSVDAGRTDD